jgi:hypothetical protein
MTIVHTQRIKIPNILHFYFPSNAKEIYFLVSELGFMFSSRYSYVGWNRGWYGMLKIQRRTFLLNEPKPRIQERQRPAKSVDFAIDRSQDTIG